MLVDDDRAISDKDCVTVTWKGSHNRVKELRIRGREGSNARFEPVTEREPRFGLGEAAQ